MRRGAQILPAPDFQTLDDHLLENRGADAVTELCFLLVDHLLEDRGAGAVAELRLESSLATAAAMLRSETTRAPDPHNFRRTSAARFPYLHISFFELR
jgi:hypothetical protein